MHSSMNEKESEIKKRLWEELTDCMGSFSQMKGPRVVPGDMNAKVEILMFRE